MANHTNGQNSLSDGASPDYYSLNLKLPTIFDRQKKADEGVCSTCRNAIWDTHACKVINKENPDYNLQYLEECSDYKKRRIKFKWFKIFLLKIIYSKWFIPDIEYFELMGHVIQDDDDEE